MTERTVEWINSNRYRSYPFEEDSDLTVEGIYGTYVLPDWVITDITLVDTTWSTTVTRDNMRSEYSLVAKSISVYSDTYLSVKFSYTVNGHEYIINTPGIHVYPHYLDNEPDIRRGVCVTHVPDASSDFDTQEIILHYTVVNRSVEKLGIPAGEYTFKSAPEILKTRIIRIPAPGIVSLGSSGESASGDIHLRPGCNCDLRIYNGVVNLVIGDGYGKGKCCDDQSSGLNDDCSKIFMFFNGQIADSDGNITLTGGPGINVSYGGEKNGIPEIHVSATPELLSYV